MIITFVDKLTKMIHLQPCHSTATAADIAKIFFDHVFKHHGLPESIICDRDAKFSSAFWQSLFNHLGTKIKMSTAYHPQTDGQTERANRTVEDMLSPFVNQRLDNWADLLPAAEFAYNSSVQASTGYTPFYLNYGQHPASAAALAAGNVTRAKDANANVFVQRLRETLDLAVKNLES
jgi:transposase InsO family protein